MSRVTKLQKKYKATRSGGERWLMAHTKQCRDSRRQGRPKYSVSYWDHATAFLNKLTNHMNGIVTRYYETKKAQVS